MDVTLRPKNFKLGTEQEVQIRKRIAKLPRHLEGLHSTEVIVTQQPTRLSANRHQYVVQITLVTKNASIIRAECTNEDVLTAVDEALTHLTRQIERYKARYERKRRASTSLGRSSAELASSITTGEFAPTRSAEPAVGTSPPMRSARGRKNNVALDTGPLDESELGEIVKVKRFSLKPIFPEDAIEQMDMLGHSFFVFFNASDERVNVVYKRNDGNYGLIQPEAS